MKNSIAQFKNNKQDMAHIIKYKCKKCGYETDLYEGRGFMGQHIEMITCEDCHTVQPLVVGGVIADSAPVFSSLAGRLCLNCGSTHIKPWDRKTCPKCGKPMIPTGETKFWT